MPVTTKPQDANTRARRELAARARARDKELGWQLTRNPARMRIQTIDSFCAGLTRQMPLLSKLGGQPEVIEDAGDLYREAAANTLKLLEDGTSGTGEQPVGATYSAAVETLLERLDNDLPRTRDMLVVMLQKRDQWLRQLVGQRPATRGPGGRPEARRGNHTRRCLANIAAGIDPGVYGLSLHIATHNLDDVPVHY